MSEDPHLQARNLAVVIYAMALLSVGALVGSAVTWLFMR
jgi:hypothetical protein